MARCLFEWSKCGLLNIECCNIKCVHRSSQEYSLGWCNVAGAKVSGTATALTKKFEDRKIDKREFNKLQTLHLEMINNLSNIGSKMAAETRFQFEKSPLEGFKDLRKELKKEMPHNVHSLLYVISLQSIYYQPSHPRKGQKVFK